MRLLISSDWHLRESSADVVFRGLDEFLARAVDHGADLVVLGDVWEFRYRVEVRLQNRFADWVSRVLDAGKTLRILPGNHDQDDVIGRNALEVFDGWPDVTVYTDVTVDDLGLWLPFRRDPEVLVQALRQHRGRCAKSVAWIHHGVAGALMNDHVVATEADGLPLEAFDGWERVFAGHWHRHHVVGNVVYVGSPWETTVREAGQDKGFLSYNTDSGEWVQIPTDFGPRHHDMGTVNGSDVDLSAVSPGDVVRVTLGPDADPRALARKADEAGVVVRMATPPPVYDEDRLGLGAQASARDVLRAYAQDRHGDFSPDELLAVFDEVMS